MYLPKLHKVVARQLVVDSSACEISEVETVTHVLDIYFLFSNLFLSIHRIFSHFFSSL